MNKLSGLSTSCVGEISMSGALKQIINPTVNDVNQPTADKEYCTELTNLCFKYPSSWTIKSGAFGNTVSGEKLDQEVTFYNKFGTKIAKLVNNMGGVGHECDETTTTPTMSLSIYESKKLDLSNGTNDVYATRGHLSNKGAYTPIITITTGSELFSTVKTSTVSECDTGLWNVFSISKPTGVQPGSYSGDYTTFGIEINNSATLDGEGFFFRDETSVKDWVENNDGKTLFDILSTAYVK